MSVMIDMSSLQNGFSFARISMDLRKKPLVFALGLHFVIFIFLLLPADFFQADRNLDEIYTVDLFEAIDTKDLKPAELSPPVAEIKKPLLKKEVLSENSKPVTSLAPLPTSPAEVISLKPRLLKKDLRAKKISKSEQYKVNSALDRLKNDLERKEAEQKARESREAASAAAVNAVEKLRQSLHSSLQPSTPSSVPGKPHGPAHGSSGSGSGSSSQLDAALKLYYVAVSQQIHAHWILPELQEWKKDLRTVVVVHVRRDGIVTKQKVEEKSDNMFFNQFVQKTLKESLPLPPFPQDLKEDSLEIGLVFHPSGLE